jgi:hypothetical protein
MIAAARYNSLSETHPTKADADRDPACPGKNETDACNTVSDAHALMNVNESHTNLFSLS